MPIDTQGLPQVKEHEDILRACLLGQTNFSNKGLVELSHSNKKLQLIDAKASQFSFDFLQNLIEQRNALTQTPLHTIFIVLKFQTFYNHSMLKLFRNEVKKIQTYKDHVVLIVSDWQQSTDKTRDKKEIIEALKEDCDKIIFYSEEENSKEIIDVMQAFMSNMDAVKVEISDKEFIENFEVFDRFYAQLKKYTQSQFDHLKDFRSAMKNLASGFNVFGDKRDDLLIEKLDSEFKSIYDRFMKSLRAVYEEITYKLSKEISQQSLFEILWKLIENKVNKEIEEMNFKEVENYKSQVLANNCDQLMWTIKELQKLSLNESSRFILDELRNNLNLYQKMREMQNARKATYEEKLYTKKLITDIEKKGPENACDLELIFYALFQIFQKKGILLVMTKKKLEEDETLRLHSRSWLSALMDFKYYETKFNSKDDFFVVQKIKTDEKYEAEFIDAFKEFIEKHTGIAKENITVIEVKQGSVQVAFMTNIPIDTSRLQGNLIIPDRLRQHVNSHRSTIERSIMEEIHISEDMLNSDYDMDYTSTFYQNKVEKRGKEDYFFPFTWKRKGLNMRHFGFQDLKWLGMNNRDDEWSVAFHGIRNEPLNTLGKIINDSSGKPTLKAGHAQACASDIDQNRRSAGYGQPCGDGVYCTPKAEVAEGYTSEVEFQGIHIKIVLQCRINPRKFRDTGYENYYVINSPEDIRPYSVLYKIRGMPDNAATTQARIIRNIFALKNKTKTDPSEQCIIS